MKKLSDDQVLEMLNSTFVSSSVLAERYGVSRQTVDSVLAGRAYADVYPEIPRLNNRASCLSCVFVTEKREKDENHCSMGVPEALETGMPYARFCGMFFRKSGNG